MKPLLTAVTLLILVTVPAYAEELSKDEFNKLRKEVEQIVIESGDISTNELQSFLQEKGVDPAEFKRVYSDYISTAHELDRKLGKSVSTQVILNENILYTGNNESMIVYSIKYKGRLFWCSHVRSNVKCYE